MQRYLHLSRPLILLLALLLVQPPVALARPAGQDIPAFGIRSPVAGQAVQGVVPILGSTAVDGFLSMEVAFAYAGHTSNTWFLIAESQEPVLDGTLTEWDTTTISDGNYMLRLSVFLADGTRQDVTLDGVRVRNYSPVETDTPTPIPTSTPPATRAPAPTATPTLTLTPTHTPVPLTATPLPTNPAQVPPGAALVNLLKGVLATMGVFAGLGAYYQTRAVLRKSRQD